MTPFYCPHCRRPLGPDEQLEHGVCPLPLVARMSLSAEDRSLMSGKPEDFGDPLTPSVVFWTCVRGPVISALSWIVVTLILGLVFALAWLAKAD